MRRMQACIDECQPNTSQANYSEGFWRMTSKINAKIEVRKHLESVLACSKRSDSGERCGVEKAMKSRGGLGRGHLSSSLAFTFSRSLLLCTAPHYLNAWNRLNLCMEIVPHVLETAMISFLFCLRFAFHRQILAYFDEFYQQIHVCLSLTRYFFGNRGNKASH